MSSFDDALRREQASDRAQQARESSSADQKRRLAEAAAPFVVQVVQDFARSLSGRVKPVRVETGVVWRRSLGYAWDNKPLMSPDGYPLEVHAGVLCSVVTPDGKLWTAQKEQTGHGPKWSDKTEMVGRYVDVTADAIIRREVNLTDTVWVGEDGRAYVGEPLHDEGPVPVETAMARHAQKLLTGN